MLFKEAVSKRIYELCNTYNYTPNKLAELSACLCYLSNMQNIKN